MLSRAYEAMRRPLRQSGIWRTMPPVPPATPWLAVFLTPFSVVVDSEAAQEFGDFERCLAWGLMT